MILDQHTRDPEGDSAVLRKAPSGSPMPLGAADPSVDVLVIDDPTRDAEKLADRTAPLCTRRAHPRAAGGAVALGHPAHGPGVDRWRWAARPRGRGAHPRHVARCSTSIKTPRTSRLGTTSPWAGSASTSALIDRHVAERETPRRRTRSSRRRHPESASRGLDFGGRAGQAVCFLRPRRPRAVGRAEHGAPSSSSGPGHRPFKAAARVRIPLGALLHPSIG